MAHIVLQKRRVAILNKEVQLRSWRRFAANHNQAHQNLNQKKQKAVDLWHNRIDSHW